MSHDKDRGDTKEVTGMSPTDILRDEHDLILEMLRVIESVCSLLETGKGADPAHLDMMIDFISGFADHCHHVKEEKLLFPAMEAVGITREGGPIGVMLAEHTMGRDFVKSMRSAAAQYKNGDTTAAEKFAKNARDYVSLLQAHIMKENNVLFAMADAHIPAEKMKELSTGFERVEREETGEGVHEKYHQMLHALRDVYLE